MVHQSIQLFNSSFIGSTAASTFKWDGGRSAIVINATQYGGGVFLQCLGPSGAWISLNASTYSADQITSYDLPSSNYRIISNQGSSIGLVAYLCTIPYS